MKRINIAIDGPSGSGKSTVSRAVAKRLNIIYVDTGALYRSIGLYMYDNGIEPSDAEKADEALNNIKIEMKFEDNEQKIYLNGIDVGDRIRENIISMYASKVSAIPCVREFLLDLQRDIAEKNSTIMDGRDIGTVVLPNADVKIFMTASAENRAKRRFDELISKGKSITYEQVLSDMIKRDEDDRTRKIAPAVPAKDAVIFDNTNFKLNESVDFVIGIIKDKTGNTAI